MPARITARVGRLLQLHGLWIAQKIHKVFETKNGDPLTAISFVDNYRDFPARIVDRLGEPIVGIAGLDALTFEMNVREFGDNIRRILRSAELLPAPCRDTESTQELGQLALAARALSPAVERHVVSRI